MVDPSASDVDRLAAARFLAATSAEAFDPLDSYGVRERGDDTGTVPDDLRLSPSQAVRYRACPRAFAIERYLLTTVEESVYMRFGTLVHKVVEATERTAIEAGRPRGTIADALRTLDDVWDDRGLGSDTVGMAWKHRAAAMLRDLYERWPSDGVPVSLEVDLPLELGGVSWLGRADRIEREGETLTVVDYKTGSAASLADAAVSLQLGYYLLAARDHEHLAQEGRVDAAVFWHPKQIAYGKVTTRWFDMDNIDTVRDDLIAIADAIRSEQFDPTPGSHCRTCPAIAICPAQPIGVEAFIA